MKLYRFILSTFLVLGVSAVYTQEELEEKKVEVYETHHIEDKGAVPYEYVREADVMWSKTIWRMVDLRQKQNYSLYYPSEPIGDRMNLTDALLKGIETGGIRAYSTTDDMNEFTQEINIEDINRAFGAQNDTVQIWDIENEVYVDQIVENERRTSEIKKLLIKEKWYFDKQHSVLRVRVIGICPIRVYPRLDDDGLPTEEIKMKKTFWVYYPEARDFLARAPIFNEQNDAQQISFDDFFKQRRFSSYIYQESNAQNNRRIGDYTSGLETLYEADRIKMEMFKFEHDLWEY